MRPTAVSPPRPATLEEAYRYCERLARTHYENFTVGSLLIPKAQRRHVYAIYGFCRTVDDLGDEAQGERLKRLDAWERGFRLCYDGTPAHPVLVALQATIQAFDLPPEPFLKLVEANRIDQRAKLHPTYQDLLRYCDHSANPVGHLFLYLFGYRDADRQRLADASCTALQLTNFWQDVRRDLDKGRIYIPLEDIARFGYSQAELERGVVNESFRRMMAFEVARTRDLFAQGLKLVDMVDGVARVDIALFSLGGLAVLKAIERQKYDTLAHRPALSRARKGWLLLSMLAKARLGVRPHGGR